MAKCKIHEPAAFHADIPEGGPRPAQATVLYVGAVHGDQIHERTLAGIRRCAVLRGWNVRCVEKGAATSGNVGETLRANHPVAGCIVEASDDNSTLPPRCFGRLPTVYFHASPALRRTGAVCIGTDNEAIARAAFSELASGRPNAYAAVGVREGFFWSRARVRAFRRLAAETGAACHVFPTRNETKSERLARLAAAIRKTDPNHMVLGCRFAGGPAGIDPVVFEAAAEYCDVVSFNQYPWVNLDTGEIACLAAFDRAHETARKPFLVTEWSFAALDSGLPCTHGAGQRFRTQKERAAAAEMFLNAILSRPYFAGHSFFRWVDEPALGVNRYFPENTNYGLVNERGEPYAELVATFARIQGGGGASLRPPAGGTFDLAREPQQGVNTRDGGLPERERYFAADHASIVAGATSPASAVGFRQEPSGG